MSKLFRGQALNDTALLAREAIQNSSDAARTFRVTHADARFRVVFRFVHLFGQEKADAISALGLYRLAERRSDYAVDPLQPGNVLDDLDDPRVPLKLLYVEDYGTHGLCGSIHIGKRSHLFKAMYYIGASDKAADAGGSYGFGKSALLRASRIQSVIAHSGFEALSNDPVRSRLVGFTWWPDLQVDDQLWKGRLSFADHSGDEGDQIDEPFEDAQADEIAASLGFQPRDTSDLDQLGSSFLIIDPAIEPDDLVGEIERWWWPALEEHRLDVQVILPTEEVKVPRPANNSFVAPFLRAFRIATRLDEPTDSNKERLASEEWRDRAGVGGKDLGSLGLVVPDLISGDDTEDFERAPSVALMRGPRMVIQYMDFPRRRIPLRGVFIASDAIDGLLRETEPSSHDRWTDNDSGDVQVQAIETARIVLRKIKDSVGRMANDITPTAPKASQSLGHFSKLMSGFLGKKSGAGGIRGGIVEKIELQFPAGRPVPERLNDAEVRIRTLFSVRASDDAPHASCEVRVSCQLYIFEDDSQSQSTVKLSLKPDVSPSGFVEESDGVWSGTIRKDDAIVFEVISDAYPNLWTTSLQPTVTRTGEWADL